MVSEIKERYKSNIKMNIAIIGTGNVGLITGACLAHVGNSVMCYDVNKKKIDNLKDGKIDLYEPGLDKIVLQNLDSNLFFTNSIKNTIENSDIIFLTVGTPMNSDGSTNMDYIYSAAKDIGVHINSKKIIVTKSTIPIGETYKIKNIITSIIKDRDVEINFDVANNPEFLKEGKGVSDFMSPDRIVVGVDNELVKKIFVDLYRPFSINHEKLIFMDINSSELTKYVSNAMLATKISFINEISILAETLGADINDVRKGIGSDSRIGYSYIYPSIGYGGSCFKKDLNSMINFSQKHNLDLKIIKSVEETNQYQKQYFLDKILQRFGGGKTMKNKVFTIWGLSFKPGTSDVRGAVSIYIINQILKHKGIVNLYDPKAINNIKEIFKDTESVNYFNDKYEAVNSSDALILLTEWPEFRSPNFNLMKEKLNNDLIFDGRNQYDKLYMKSLGFEYYQIGVKKI